MKILLLSAPYLKDYMRNARCDFVSLSGTQWYPIILGCCGAFLEGHGHEVKLLDAPAHGLDHERSREIVRSFKPELLVLYTGVKSEENDIEFAEPLMKELGADCVIAGPFASINPAGTLAKCKLIDKLAVGEFDKAVLALAEKKSPAEIPGLVFKTPAGLKSNPPGPYLTGAELDAIPFVSKFFKEQLDLKAYRTPSEAYPFIDVMSGRGCKWGMCTYCLWVHTFIKGQVYNTRSVKSLVDEFKYIESELPEVKSVMIQDDTFTQDRILEFCKAKIEAGVKIQWSCYSRGDLDLDTLKLMKKANVRNLHVGFESASPEVLRRVKKGLSAERMTKFAADAKKAGVRIHGDFAFGFPGETPEDAMKTVEWACKMNPDTAQFQLMIPFPGTPFYEEMKGNGWLNADGQPDMPQFSNVQIREIAKKAYRAFYLSPRHAWKCLTHPYDHFYLRWKTMLISVPALFWQRWKV